ncbi:hypothetical protein LTR27_004389 [Elasticomyces elasticus]|nr:hypothetical protein LTR27_004389 [Elasticomyces elasticus]
MLEAIALALASVRLPWSTDSMDKWTAFETGLIEETKFAGFFRYEYEPSSARPLSDSLVVGQKYGLDPQTMIDALNVGTGVCFPTMDTFRRDGITGRYNSGFGLALPVKDLGITEEFMQHNGFEIELPSSTKRYLADVLKEVEPDADHTKCLSGWENRAGVELKRIEQVKDIPEEGFEHRLKTINRPAQ